MPDGRRIGREKAAERVMGRKMVRSLAAREWPRLAPDLTDLTAWSKA